IVVAGTTKPEFEKEILKLFDKVVSSKDDVYHAHMAKKGRIFYPIIFNVYGAPAMVDVLTEMHDGGCRTVIFVGYAYGGFKNLDIGAIVLPNKSYHFEGIYHPIKPDKTASLPDKHLDKKLKQLFKKNYVKFVEGVNISVPAVTFQLPHANKAYKKLDPLTVEMELASCYARSKDIGIRAAGILIVSDNKKVSIANKREVLHFVKKEALALIIKNISRFQLPPLRTKKEFNIDKHLASIIEDPNDITNIYKKKN
ncbi:hypothetical protein HY643_05035, partial [Candidatus Woesearchaeota archaeon]|nr:hypothetical protein [Candidatus Woesearchaeota archaeon]